MDTQSLVGEPDNRELRRSQIREVIPIFAAARRARKEANRRITIGPSRRIRRGLQQLSPWKDFDSDKFEEIRAKAREELHVRAQKLRADTTAHTPLLDVINLATARRVEAIRSSLAPQAQSIWLDMPDLIFLNTPNAQVESTVYRPYYSAGKFAVSYISDDDSAGDDENISFYFSWTNPSNDPIQLTAIATPWISGFGQLWLDGGLFTSEFQDASIDAHVSFGALKMWTDPPELAPEDSNNYDHTTIGMLRGQNAIYGDSLLQQLYIDKAWLPGYYSPNSITVPGNGRVIFEANVDISLYVYGGGWVSCEATDAYVANSNWGVYCSFVGIGIE